jgi:hypothetical protein
MSWISWLVGKSDKGIISQVTEGVERFTGSKAATAEQNERAEIRDNEQQSIEDIETTKRWVSDSTAPITRLVRPLSYLFVTFIVFIFGGLEASIEGFKLSESYIQLYKEGWIIMTVAYFGSRGWEKIKGKVK